LRLEELRRGEVPFVSVRLDETTIIDLLATERTGENMNHVAITVEDVDLDALVASGRFEVVGGPAKLFGAQGVGMGIYIRDPDGNTVELRTY
jgi:catechol 2,3-dioxygenase-like lactoylglutathione lyase family enzyme